MRAFLKTFFLLILLSGLNVVQAQEVSDTTVVSPSISFGGQVAVWEVTLFSNPVIWQTGGRFVPTMLGNFPIGENSKLEFEASLHLNGNLNYSGLNFTSKNGEISPYRVWLRYSTDHWEIRGGLQKINFGSAKIFRPLMWFDEMDVRDPLKLTNGVYGILGKYFFENNANIWLWTLIGNKNAKGYELIGSAARIPEIGGRIETPLGPGELAFSTHFRNADLHSLFPLASENTKINEKRFGLDGKWDFGVGLWFESSVSLFDKNDFHIPLFQDIWNIGADYTIPIGSGLNITAEYIRFHTGNKMLNGGTSVNMGGSMFTYPVSLLDNVSAMFFYLKEAGKWFNYLSYSRTYDDWNIYLIGFWNPEINIPIGGKVGTKNLFAGKGMQLMVSYNF